ncbi:MAG: hypothetical protein IT457_02085, partial [Planctomycetes bacterium]|nr:hypothetical protein [Planctomycetota bacterium]
MGANSKLHCSQPSRRTPGFAAAGQLHVAVGALLAASLTVAAAWFGGATSLSNPGSAPAAFRARPEATPSASITPTTSNAPRTDDGGAGSDAKCRTGLDGIGAVELPLIVTGPSTGGPPSKTADGPFTQEKTPTEQSRNPAIPTAPGSTVRLDGSVVYHLPLLEPPS